MTKESAIFGGSDNISITNNAKSGLIDFKFKHDGQEAVMSLTPMMATYLVNLALVRLMERKEPEITEGLQTFALKTIEAKLTPRGEPYLEYYLGIGLGFGTGMPRDHFVALYHQLGEVLGLSPPADRGGKPH